MTSRKPKFRPDIRIHYHDDGKGARSIVLEDPVAARFFRISPHEFELLRILDGTLSLREAMEKLRIRGKHFALPFAARLLEQFSGAGLLLGTPHGTAKVQVRVKERMDQALKSRSLSKLFFMYVPVVNPDRFLEKTLPFVRLFVNQVTLALVALLIPGALYFLVRDIGRLDTEFLFFFNVKNLMVLWIAIALVKLVHEFAHAYVAKSLGLRVPEMGVAFLIFFPCLYCNTTDAWQLADRRQRMLISAAGIIAEACVATISVYIWYFSKPGLINSVSFYLMAISLISSVFFNGNPLMKFDGYFILSDMINRPNLQPRSFQFVRYLLLNKVLGIEALAAPRADLRDRVLYGVYGISCMIYRVFLCIGIVMGVYYRFDKTLGVLLGGLAFALFLIRPLITGTRNLIKRANEMRFKPFGASVFACIVLMCLYALLAPWSSNSVYPCYLESSLSRKITIPADAPVQEVFIRQGDTVREGEVLFNLDPTRLQFKLQEKQSELAYIRKEMWIIEKSEKDLSRLQLKLIELAQADDAVREIEGDLRHLEWKAPFSGYVTGLSPDLQSGYFQGKGTVVGELAALDKFEVRGLLPEADAGLVSPGQRVDIWFPLDQGTTFRLAVKEVSRFKTEDLEASPLSSRFGGEIATEVKEGAGKDVPLEAYYLCKIAFPDDGGVPLGVTGRLVVHHPPRSLLTRMIWAAYGTFHREILF